MWPTPVASDHLANNSETLDSWEKRAAQKKEQGINLHFALRHAVQMWPTPTMHNAKEVAYPAEYLRKTPTLVAEAGGKLNPQWVEWLMGFPDGHTDLNSLETQSYPKSQK